MEKSLLASSSSTNGKEVEAHHLLEGERFALFEYQITMLDPSTTASPCSFETFSFELFTAAFI